MASDYVHYRRTTAHVETVNLQVKRKKTAFSFKSCTYNIVHLSGYEQGSLCFLHSRDILHIPNSNSILTLQGKYYANKTLRDSKSTTLSNTLVAEVKEPEIHLVDGSDNSFYWIVFLSYESLNFYPR